MKKTIRFRLPRGWKIVRNLAAALLLVWLALWLFGWPDWAGYWAFRQMEAQYLLSPSQVVCTAQDGRSPYAAYLTEGEDWITVGKTTSMRGYGLPLPQSFPVICHILPKEGAVLAALPAPDEDGALIAALWGAPPEAVSGTLELDLTGVDGGVFSAPARETFTARGTREENGWFFFRFLPDSNHQGQELCAISALWEWEARLTRNGVGERPYRLTLLDSQGGTVSVQSGTLPPAQCLTGTR